MQTTSITYQNNRFGQYLTSKKSVQKARINYIYGFNTQERVDEVSGKGNHYTALYGEADPRLGRRWNLDPKPNPSWSRYSLYSDNPIWHNDILLDTPRVLTTHLLRDKARNMGVTGSGIDFNRKVGKMFENIGLQSQGLIENKKSYFSADRKSLTFNKSSTVIPDGVRSAKEGKLMTFLGIPYGTRITSYPESSFFEVKAVAGTLRLSSNNYQIQGELDAVSNSTGAKTANRGTMTFITTTNTVIAADVISYANKKNIQLYQVFAFEETDDGSIRFTPPIPLNNPRSGKSLPINITPLIKGSDISKPYFLNTSIGAEPQGTQDPEVVE